MLHLIENLAGDWHRLDERIEGLSGEIEAIARQDAGCEQLSAILASLGSRTHRSVALGERRRLLSSRHSRVHLGDISL
jgi:hypothetical protein